MKRCIILGLDDAHGLLEARLGKEVTPDTISHYMEVLNHALPGAAVIQEHMVETKPMLVNDCYAKVFTGDDDLADALDRRFVLDINKEFPAGWTRPGEQADQLKEAIGKKIWQVLWMPTVVGRMADGETMFRWVGMQVGMTMINAYKMCAGESATGEFAYYAKHAAVVQVGNKLPVRRERGHNEPGGLPLGISDGNGVAFRRFGQGVLCGCGLRFRDCMCYGLLNKEIIKQEVLDSLAKIGKQWDLEESAIRVWGCMLLKYICLLLLILRNQKEV